MASPVLNLNVPQFIQQVRCRPEIWMIGSEGHRDTRRMASAWKQICRLTWPDFDTWPLDRKRNKCLILQKKWKDLRQEFLGEYHRQKKRGGPSAHKSQHHDLLTFLITNIGNESAQDASASEGRRPPAKRSRRESSSSDSVELVTEVEPSVPAASVQEDNEEDRLFLLSLLSYMSEVPRTSKLALREDMLRLLRKYTPGSRTAAD